MPDDILESNSIDVVLDEAAELFEDAEGYDSSMIDIIDFLNPTQSE